MDQKHAMLYPDPNSMPSDQRSSAAAAMGLPIEAPPSYDMATRDPAMSSPVPPQHNIGWSASAPPGNPTSSSAYNPAMAHHSHPHHPNVPVVVEQPRYPPTPAHILPHQPTVPPRQPHESAAATVQTTPVLSSQLGPNPSKVTCPACGASKISRMCYTPNSKTHLCAFILCLVGWCCCACVVPYCMNSCRTGNHYCAKCNAFLGAYQPRTNLL